MTASAEKVDLGVVGVNHIPDIGKMIRRLVRLFNVWNLGAPKMSAVFRFKRKRVVYRDGENCLLKRE